MKGRWTSQKPFNTLITPSPVLRHKDVEFKISFYLCSFVNFYPSNPVSHILSWLMKGYSGLSLGFTPFTL
ncbi:MAG: hypothetical protein WCO72_15445, partial [Betaproteobacteria bacterium]